MTGPKTFSEIEKECTDRVHSVEQAEKNLIDLEKEGFIKEEKGKYLIK